MKTHMLLPNGGKIGFCCEASTRRGFKRVIKLIQMVFNAKIVDKAEGPGVICWWLKIDNTLFYVELTDWGIFPLNIVIDESAEDLMIKIRECIEDLPLKEPDLSLLQRLLRLLEELLHLD